MLILTVSKSPVTFLMSDKDESDRRSCSLVKTRTTLQTQDFIWATKSKPENLLKTETPLIQAHTPQTQNTVSLSPSRSPYMLHTFPDLKQKKSTNSVQLSLLFKTHIFCLSLNNSWNFGSGTAIYNKERRN
ncbi:hypothetical protein NC652_030917 [Populus alba x Populus x berolinensis]|nr:hypothetical protein NC652_030917 [Populus alba x Populus x berolinensis]